jgi:hypothetical protein
VEKSSSETKLALLGQETFACALSCKFGFFEKREPQSWGQGFIVEAK